MKYKDKIVTEKGTIISKCDSVWVTITKEMDHITTPSSLYTFVTCNRYNVRDKLMNRFPPTVSPEHELITNTVEGTLSSAISTSIDTTMESPIAKTVSTFTITIPKEEYQSMIMCKRYRRREKVKQNPYVSTQY